MSVIYADPVGTFVGTFEAIKPTKNPNWLKASFLLNTHIQVDVKQSFLVPSKDSEVFNQLKNCQPGQVYRLVVGVSVEGSRSDPDTGKTYPPRLQCKLIKISS